MSGSGWASRLLMHATTALLVAAALLAAFAAEDSRSLRLRLCLVRCRWRWAARDATTTATEDGSTVVFTSTWQTALRLLSDVIGDM